MKTLSIIERRNSHTLRTPNGNFTMGYSGERATDLLAGDAKAFDALIKFVKAESVKPGMNFGKAFELLTDEKVIGALWPTWNQAKQTFPVGEVVRVINGNNKLGTGIVEGTHKSELIVNFGGRRVRISANILESI